MTTEPRADPLIGRTISQYEVAAKLGGGGTGTEAATAKHSPFADLKARLERGK